MKAGRELCSSRPMHNPEQTITKGRASRLTELLDQQNERVQARDVAVVIAHPDDETIGCGAQIARWTDVTLVLVTDGAPLDLKDARALGFATGKEYAEARRSELLAALAVAGQPPESLVCFDIPDQEVSRRLVDATHRTIKLVKERNLRVLFTQAYEGGHPDHDATAFAVHAAARLLKAQGHPVLVVEMPYYRLESRETRIDTICRLMSAALQHLGSPRQLLTKVQSPRDAVISAKFGAMTRQQFIPVPGAGQEFTIHLSPGQEALKRRMMAAHRTQEAILAAFDVSAEYFRTAPNYDFSELPNEGRLLYEQEDWSLNGHEWLRLSRAALTELGLDSGLC